MKVGIISERLNRPMTGVGTYTQNLIKEISRILPEDSVYLIDYTDHRMFSSLNKIIIGSFVVKLPKKSYIWHLYSQFKLRENNFDLDIIHSPENSTLVTKLKNQKKIVTVHDIRQHVFPEFNIETILSYLLLSRTLKNADKIIADSNNTKKDLISYFHIPEDKIHVIYLAANKIFKPLNDQEIKAVKERYNLNFPFILYIGNLTKHKNIPLLIKAFYDVKQMGCPQKLVITGKKKWKYKEIFNTIDKLDLHDEVIFTGYVPEEDLPALYNSADLFVYPSIYEGFGLPPLEAMACGCPVVTSNASSLPEVVGDAGIMVDPNSANELSNAINIVLKNDVLRKNLVIKGLNRAKMFSWEKCAKDTISVYCEVYNNTQLRLK